MNAGCFAHCKTNVATGFFHNQIGRKYAWGRLYAEGQEFEAQLKLDCIHRQQRGQALAGRYFGISAKGRIHLCHCRVTKAEFEKARREARKFMAGVEFA
jgi:hypothetical protein